MKMDIKSEGVGLIKTLSAIAASFGVVWTFVEPMVENYIHDQIEVVKQEDKKLIDELKLQLDDDFFHHQKKRNEIIEEFKYFMPNSRLKIEQ